jgi:hypothetical protein
MVIDVLLEEKMISGPFGGAGIRSFRGNAHARRNAGMPFAAGCSLSFRHSFQRPGRLAMKRSQSRMSRASECYELLEFLSRRQMPVVCSEPDDIHKILALRSASLLQALTEPTVVLRTGERRIERAIVTAITAEGRAACMMRSATAPGAGRR